MDSDNLGGALGSQETCIVEGKGPRHQIVSQRYPEPPHLHHPCEFGGRVGDAALMHKIGHKLGLAPKSSHVGAAMLRVIKMFRLICNIF